MEGVDRINELRDEILVNNIMSRLDCTTKELIRTTATISKRWINLWTQLPNLIFTYRYDHAYFRNDDTHLCDYISFIDNTLIQCPANLNLKKFKLYINYNSVVNSEFKSRANSWIRYAISHNVEDVDLWLRDVGVGQEFTFEDEMFFKTSCITRMTLSFCRFNPPNGAISWERLECLCLSCVTLDEYMIEKILSGSPCLESLELDDCHGYRRIDVTSRSVKKLVFSDYYYCDESEVDYIDSELDYSIVPGTSNDITPEEILRGLLESLDHVKDVIINDFWWEFYDDLKACGDISNGCSLEAVGVVTIDFPDKPQTLSSGGTVSAIKTRYVKEVDCIEKQFDDTTPSLLFGLVSVLIE
ncbi:thiamine thiazole synthase, chloroplastic-like protein [Tanacetum coccineum]